MYVDMLICSIIELWVPIYTLVRCRKVILLGGSVHVNIALYGSRPRFIIHWHMKVGDKVPCKSYILFCIIYQGYAREDRIQVGRYLLLL